MSTVDASEHEALLQFLYLSPVGLAQIDANGQVQFINPKAASLLMPLSPDGGLENLFRVFESVAPEVRNMCEGFALPSGQVCDGHRIQLTAGLPGKEDPRILSISIVKLDPQRTMAVIADATLIAKRERLLRQSETWLNALVGGVDDYALMTLDSAGRVLQWNESIGRVTGFGPEMLKQPYSIFYPADAMTPERLADRLREADHEGWSLDEGWRLRSDGSRFWGSVLIAPLELGSDLAVKLGAVTGADRRYGMILRDIGDQREATQQLRLAHSADHLTGLFNRRAFFEAAELEIKRGRQVPRQLSLLMIDADRFKQVNDRHGHSVGDLVL